jgi:hypothetical protein
MSTHTVVAVPQAVPLTSEISSEVELAPQADVELLIKFGSTFKSFKQSLPQVKAAAIKLKKAFGVRQGCQGRTLKVEGREMTWKGFVEKYYGIGPRRFNQIMEIEDDPVSGMAKKKATASKANPVDHFIGHLKKMKPRAVRAELNRIIRKLKLAGKLIVTFVN